MQTLGPDCGSPLEHKLAGLGLWAPSTNPGSVTKLMGDLRFCHPNLPRRVVVKTKWREGVGRPHVWLLEEGWDGNEIKLHS